jgi:photosystem II stability/assembly factor-like uncharacterized protein
MPKGIICFILTALAVATSINSLAAQDYQPRGVGGGGAMSGFSMSPYSSLWFVGTDMGTLYRSDNKGTSWQGIPYKQVNFYRDLTLSSSVGFSPDQNTVYWASAGCDPKTSNDGGQTWQKMTGLQTLLPQGSACLDPSNQTRIRYWANNNTNRNIFFAALDNGLLITENAGTTWQQVSGISGKSLGTFIDYVPSKKGSLSVVYHGTPSGIYRSDDGGKSFSPYYSQPIKGFTAGRDVSGITMAIIDASGNAPCTADMGGSSGQPGSDSTSICGWVWVKRGDNNFVKTNQAAGDGVYMAENDAKTLYVIGKLSLNDVYGTQVWRSRDAGNSWKKVFQELLPLFGGRYEPWPADLLQYSAIGLDVGWDDAGYWSFSVNKSNSQELGGSTNYFLLVSKDGGDHWLSPFTEFAGDPPPAKQKFWKSTGLDPTSSWTLKFHPKNSKIGYVGYADIGCLATEDGGTSWRICKNRYNTSYDYAFDPNNDNLVYAASSSLHDFPYDWYGNVSLNVGGGVFKSSDRGKTWERLTPENGEFLLPYLAIAFDAKNNILYAGSQGRGVARSLDGGASWQWFNQGLGTAPAIISQIEIDPQNNDIYILRAGNKPDWTDLGSTGIYRLKNGTNQWEHLRKTVQPPGDENVNYVGPLWRYPNYFAIDWSDPSRSKIWLADVPTAGPYKATGIWLTTNGGQTWARSLNYYNPRTILINPNNPQQVVITGFDEDQGNIMYTTNGGQSWQAYQPLPFMREVAAITIDPNDTNQAFFTSFGGGMLYGQNPFGR